MSRPFPTRRRFLSAAACTGVAGALGDFAALLPVAPAGAAEATVTPDLVRFGPEIESVVRLLEQTPRERCVPVMMDQMRRGLPYRHFLAALYLAAIRAAKWHGGVHAYDHNAYVVHSVHQLALDLPPAEHVVLPFYALDSFKGMQQAYPGRPGTPALAGTPPAAEAAGGELDEAMRQWDPTRAELAVVALVRSGSIPGALEPLWQYAGRDWRFIGHMAILVANSARLLETIGWRHAEHVLRYVAAGLAGWPKDAADGPQNQPYPANVERVERTAGRLPAGWAGAADGPDDEALTRDLLASVRAGKADEACELAARRLTGGAARAGAVWDAVHLAAAELVLSSKPHNDRRPVNSSALHANTAANALHYAFRASARRETRLLLTLQALAWMHLFRDGITRAGHLAEAVNVTGLTGAELPASPDDAVAEILATRTADPRRASRLAFAYAQTRPAGPLLQAARRLMPAKSSGDPHDIKFPVAIFEDVDLVSPRWRPHVLAAAAYSFWGSERPDLPVVRQVREAARGL